MPKKKHPEHVNLERWLVSYADFITLLFAFFVVMYAMSQADMAKMKKVSSSVKRAFNSAGPAGMVDLQGSGGGSQLSLFDHQRVSGGRVLNLPAGKTHTAGDAHPDLQTLKERLEETLSLELGVSNFSDSMQMVYDSRGLIVRLAAKDFFGQGEDFVEGDLKPILSKIGEVISTTQRHIRIEGHADRSEIGHPNWKSTWELGAARATWVARFWLRKFGMDPRRVGIASFAHFRPLRESTNEWARGTNRRIEIVILNSVYED